MPLSTFSVDYLPLGMQSTLKSSLVLKETSLKEIKFSIASGYQLKIASDLGLGHVSTSAFSSRTPSGADPCRL